LYPDRVAFVTGAGGFIGQACVLQFARDGVTRIAGLDISADGLAKTASLLHDEFTEQHFLQLVTNLAIEEEVEAAFRKVVNAFGLIDYGVNNAGIGGSFKPYRFGSNPDSQFERVMVL
jgi:NAD(P)-dependent dehydrogenase (short-subunit alcohol dehydrogenase family)